MNEKKILWTMNRNKEEKKPAGWRTPTLYAQTKIKWKNNIKSGIITHEMIFTWKHHSLFQLIVDNSLILNCTERINISRYTVSGLDGEI